jgi:hypothetical protein
MVGLRDGHHVLDVQAPLVLAGVMDGEGEGERPVDELVDLSVDAYALLLDHPHGVAALVDVAGPDVAAVFVHDGDAGRDEVGRVIHSRAASHRRLLAASAHPIAADVHANAKAQSYPDTATATPPIAIPAAIQRSART